MQRVKNVVLAAVLVALACVCGAANAEQADAAPAMAEPSLMETGAHAGVEMVLAALTDESGAVVSPPSQLPAKFSMEPVVLKPKKDDVWRNQQRRPLARKAANIVAKAELRNIIAYDAEQRQHDLSRVKRLKRIRSGETARPKLLPAHYHTSNLVSPAQDKVTAEVLGFTGDSVEPEVIGHVPTAGPAAAPRFVTPTYTRASKKPLSRPATTKRRGIRVHIHKKKADPKAPGAAAAGAKKAKATNGKAAAKSVSKKSKSTSKRIRAWKGKRAFGGHRPWVRYPKSWKSRRASRTAARKAGKPLAPRPLVKRSGLNAQRTRLQRRSVLRRIRREQRRRRQLRRQRARQAAAVVSRKAAVTQTPAAAAALSPAALKEADAEAKQLADAANTIRSVKGDTTELVKGQKQLLDYARTATRSNPIAERAVKIDNTILRHVDRLEKELYAMAEENKAMRALQRANLDQLKALSAMVQQQQPAKQFPHLRAVAVTITPDTDSDSAPRFEQVHSNAAAQFHATLSAEQHGEAALDSAIAQQERADTTEAATEEETNAADAGVKTEEELALEKFMASLLQSAEQQQETAADESEAEAESEAEEEESDESEAEAEAEEEESDGSESESEDESEDESESEDEAEAEDESEEEEETEEAAEAEADAEAEEDMEESGAAAAAAVTAAQTSADDEEAAAIDAESTAETDIIRLAEHNAALVEQHARRIAALQTEEDAAAEEEAANAQATADARAGALPSLSLSEVAADAAAETDAEAELTAGAADMLGLPDVPSTVPRAAPVHDDMSEVEAEVEAEFAAHRNGADADESESDEAVDALAALAPRFAQVHADAEAEAETGDDAEFDALMHGQDLEEEQVNAEIEHDLANEDAADVDINEAEGESFVEAGATAHTGDSAIDNHEGVKDLRSLVAQLNAQLNKVKAEGKALAARN